jgi:RHS repeat-associated protein
LIAGTTLGVATDSRTYNGFGELTGYTAAVRGAPVYSFEFTRAADGRITNNIETIGTANSYVYTYDAAGRLASASRNSTSDTYTYDSNSNRLSVTTPSGTTTGTYDAQDRLLTYGTASYTYTANGELATQRVASQTTTYTYDVLGNIIAVTLPNGIHITYLIDPENHRVGKEANGVLQTGFLYDGDQVVAQLNRSNQIISQFVYATGANSPDYMISGGATYRIFSDQLGSPRVIVNSSTGAIVEEISYDEFGNIISDTNPGFQPFGFAGGLYDRDTKLVRFGARDYNSSIGRWTAKDPILFAGGDTDLYGYVLEDPVNLIDLQGTDDCSCKQEKTPPNSSTEVETEAKKVGVKVGRTWLKTFGELPEHQEKIIQNKMQREVTNPSIREYIKLEKEAKKRCDDSVDPFTRILQKLWRQVNDILGSNSPQG